MFPVVIFILSQLMNEIKFTSCTGVTGLNLDLRSLFYEQTVEKSHSPKFQELQMNHACRVIETFFGIFATLKFWKIRRWVVAETLILAERTSKERPISSRYSLKKILTIKNTASPCDRYLINQFCVILRNFFVLSIFLIIRPINERNLPVSIWSSQSNGFCAWK